MSFTETLVIDILNYEKEFLYIPYCKNLKPYDSIKKNTKSSLR